MIIKGGGAQAVFSFILPVQGEGLEREWLDPAGKELVMDLVSGLHFLRRQHGRDDLVKHNLCQQAVQKTFKLGTMRK